MPTSVLLAAPLRLTFITVSCCAVQGKEHVPLAQRPEATFLPALLDHFLQLIPTVIKQEPVKAEAPATNGSATADAEDNAMQVDNPSEPAAVDTGAGDAEVDIEGSAPRRFFEDPNEPLRLEDLPAEPEEAQLLGGDDNPAGMSHPMFVAPTGVAHSFDTAALCMSQGCTILLLSTLNPFTVSWFVMFACMR